MSAPSWRILAARVLLRIQSVVADAYGNLWVDTGTNGRGTNPAMSHILAMRPSPIAGSWMSTRGTHSLARGMRVVPKEVAGGNRPAAPSLAPAKWTRNKVHGDAHVSQLRALKKQAIRGASQPRFGRASAGRVDSVFHLIS